MLQTAAGKQTAGGASASGAPASAAEGCSLEVGTSRSTRRRLAWPRGRTAAGSRIVQGAGAVRRAAGRVGWRPGGGAGAPGPAPVPLPAPQRPRAVPAAAARPPPRTEPASGT